MASNNKHSLPGSSYASLCQILAGYSHAKEPASLEEMAKSLAMDKGTISRNTGFLSDLGLITSGQKKMATDLGAALGRALEHTQAADAKRFLAEAVGNSEFVSGLVRTLRIKSGMSPDELADHALYVSGQSATQYNRTGAKTVVEILESAGLVHAEDGKLVVSTGAEARPFEAVEEADSTAPSVNEASRQSDSTGEERPNTGEIERQRAITAHNLGPNVVINVNLQIPEVDDPAVYETFFKMFRKYILDKDD